ncbi:MAG TPA: hypothetical protein ENJ27_01630 [Candidatus Moranbacteria bacterium]|nr:hypothetical protein [Candidatus Moranbacteria bacterium]
MIKNDRQKKEFNNSEIEKNEEEIEQKTIAEEIETINLVATKLKEKYSDYEALTSFIDHLAGTERIFAIAKSEDNLDHAKQKFLDAETDLMATQLGVESVMFDNIIERFNQAHNNVIGIIRTSEELKGEYADDKKIIGFIEYIKMALIEFLDLENIDNPAEIDNRKLVFIERRMKEISASGDPALEKLQNIYKEFKERLRGEKKE